MKTLKNTLVIATLIFAISCSKNDESVPPVVDTKLALPAILSNDTMFLIPDANANSLPACGSNAQPGSVVSEIVIEKNGIIKDASKVTVEIDIKHPFANEVVIELLTPNGESCGLLKRVNAYDDISCGSSMASKYQSGNKLSFNSLNTTAIGPGIVTTGNYKTTGPLTGSYPAAILMTPLNIFFKSKNIKGIWKLKAYDCSTGDVGKLNSWKIKFDTGALE